MDVLPRVLAARLLEDLEAFPAVGILGPRQVGKTTLAKSLALGSDRGVRYVDLQRAEGRQQLANPAELFGRYLEARFILDEVQALPLPRHPRARLPLFGA